VEISTVAQSTFEFVLVPVLPLYFLNLPHPPKEYSNAEIKALACLL